MLKKTKSFCKNGGLLVNKAYPLLTRLHQVGCVAMNARGSDIRGLKKNIFKFLFENPKDYPKEVLNKIKTAPKNERGIKNLHFFRLLAPPDMLEGDVDA